MAQNLSFKYQPNRLALIKTYIMSYYFAKTLNGVNMETAK